MKNKQLAAIIATLLMICAFGSNTFAADYSAVNEEGVLDDASAIDIIGDEVPLADAEAAPATGIDQSELALQRAFDVVIFGLGISLAAVFATAAIKKYGGKAK